MTSSSQLSAASNSKNSSGKCFTHNHHHQCIHHGGEPHHHSSQRRFCVTRHSHRCSPQSRRSRALVTSVLACIYLFGVTSAAPTAVATVGKHSDGDSRLVVAPYVQCARKTCDLRTHYCDLNIQNCASCEDDCQPARIQGNHNAEESCKRKCQWYYAYRAEYKVWKESVTPPATTPVIQLESIQINSEQINIASSWTLAVLLLSLVACILLLSLSNIMAWCLVFRHCSKRQRRCAVRTSQDQTPHCRANDNVDLIKARDMTDMSHKTSTNNSCRSGGRIYTPPTADSNSSSLRDSSIQPLVQAV